MGDTWIAHYGEFQKEATLAHKNMIHSNHPVLRGVADKIFCHTDVNSVEHLTSEDVVLFHGQVLSRLNPDDPPVTDNRRDTRRPCAWFKTYTAPSGKPGRSFTTTAGASLDWQSQDLRRLLINALFSLTGHENEIPEKTDVEFVEAYTPHPTGTLSDEAWTAAKLTPARWLSSLPKPLAHWKLDDVGHAALDSAGGHHGVIQGATSHEGKVGGNLDIQRWYLITFVVDNEHKNCRLYLNNDRKKTISFTGEPRLMREGQTMHIDNTGTDEFMDEYCTRHKNQALGLTLIQFGP